jgi:hypothetical protein
LNKQELIKYWIDKSFKSFNSAILEFENGYLDFAVNRLYYAIFYITSAYFFKQGKYFKKHSGIRSAFHKELVKKGIIGKNFAKLYDELFEARTEGDYKPFTIFEKKKLKIGLKKLKIF